MNTEMQNFGYFDNVVMVSDETDRIFTGVQHCTYDAEQEHPKQDKIRLVTESGITREIRDKNSPAIFMSGRVR